MFMWECWRKRQFGRTCKWLELYLFTYTELSEMNASLNHMSPHVCFSLAGATHTLWDSLKLYPDPAGTIVKGFMSAVIWHKLGELAATALSHFFVFFLPVSAYGLAATTSVSCTQLRRQSECSSSVLFFFSFFFFLSLSCVCFTSWLKHVVLFFSPLFYFLALANEKLKISMDVLGVNLRW